MASREECIDLIVDRIGDDMDLDENAFDAAIDQLGFGAWTDEALAIIAAAYTDEAPSPPRNTLTSLFSGPGPERAN